MTITRSLDLTLWIGVLAGPVAWALDLGVSYAIVQWTCGTQHTIVLHLVTLTTLGLIVGGGVAAWRAFEISRGAAADPHGELRGHVVHVAREHFMAVWGLLSCAFFAVVVVATSIPSWVLNACQ